MRTRTTAAIATVTIATLGLAGCSAGNQDDASGTAELESLSIMAPYFSATAPEAGDPVNAALNELTGVDIEMRWSPNAEYQTQTNVALAGDDVPDVMVIQGKNQGFIQTAEAGGFWDLTEYVESGDYPNLVPANSEVQEAASVNGKVYGIFRARDLIRYSVILRADWLENLGLDLPTTTDDLTAIAQAFTEDDPDQDGADDTYGLINIVWPGIGVQNPLDASDVWFGSGNVWRDDDGELTPAWATDEWKESLDWMRELREGGYMNPDFPTKDGETWMQSFISGEGGMAFAVSSNATDILKLVQETDPDNAGDYIALAAQPEGPNGKHVLPTAGYSGFLSISKSTVKTEEQLEGVLEVLDTLNSEEAQRLLHNGIEGVNYTVEDELAVYDPAEADLTTLVQQAWLQVAMDVPGNRFLLPAPANEAEGALFERRVAVAEEDLPDAVFNPAAGLISPTYVTNQTQLDQIIGDARTQYIAGTIDEAQLDAAIDLWFTSGGQQVVDELNELYAAQ